RNGGIDQRLAENIENNREMRFCPNHFLIPWIKNYHDVTNNEVAYIFDPATGQMRFNALIAAKTVVERVKSAKGRKGLADLHEYLGPAPTYCLRCAMKTGDREGYYAHYMSYRHIKAHVEFSVREFAGKYVFDIPTTIVNVLKKDLVN
ncbi:hypothetical protein PMAYCL1PPCAC_25003, partial [Pristionchus mayeri]